ncbi:hypothetical protein BAUCODRAFT_120638 [Baudoinia panamericana UAMH 10762]|uniref:WD-like domain-containing protein n=1 Tax=Baudoinia panamericana (strain UAMH 10762) TaxID=717646 RepID=M2NIZ8_BAUPA|nr:uncharacterized protein BAUCODRAFT_120638 [Baudoinia panamericana UAMH 10762]EMC99369.1 hypothetical protein BAUCODRAFT_120638 [Baudoinia panamericana UAMH 10762]
MRLASAIASSSLLAATWALPTAERSITYTAGPGGSGTMFWLSSISQTILGEDATDFDHFLYPSSDMAIEAMDTYSATFDYGSEDELVVAFLNTTMAGTMTAEQAADTDSKCQELSGNMASLVTACSNNSLPISYKRSTIEERSRWRWIESGAHVTSTVAVNVLYSALGQAVYENFPTSPRSWCNSANGENACISWSEAESFQHYFAEQLISDALSVVDFTRWSAQANGAISGADACISNRATGCT